jgi:NitT/TauT family transport system substrate-binding protein
MRLLHCPTYEARRQIRLLLGAALLLAACAGPAPNDSPTGKPEKEKITLAVGGKTGIAYLPLTIAERQGFFTEEGLSVEIQELQGGAKALQALVGGSADVVVGYYDHTIQMQAIQKEITAVALLGRYPGLVLGVRTDLAGEIKQVGDLKGRRVGVTAPGSSSHFFVNYLLSRHGLKPSDVSAIGIGASSTAVAAVEQKQVDALVNLDPMISLLTDRGLIQILADTRTAKDTQEVFGGEYPGASLYASRDFIARHPETTQRLVNALIKGLRWMRGKTPAEIAQSLPEAYFAGDRELYLKGLARSVETFSPDGLFSETAPARVLEVLALFDENVARAEIDLVRTYTNRFVAQAAK